MIPAVKVGELRLRETTSQGWYVGELGVKLKSLTQQVLFLLTLQPRKCVRA